MESDKELRQRAPNKTKDFSVRVDADAVGARPHSPLTLFLGCPAQSPEVPRSSERPASSRGH
jgi:hypothetical protein